MPRQRYIRGDRLPPALQEASKYEHPLRWTGDHIPLWAADLGRPPTYPGDFDRLRANEFPVVCTLFGCPLSIGVGSSRRVTS